MHQPLPLTHEKGVRFVHREVIHRLRLLDSLDSRDHTKFNNPVITVEARQYGADL